jgi:hypothetical protein
MSKWRVEITIDNIPGEDQKEYEERIDGIIESIRAQDSSYYVSVGVGEESIEY